MLDHVFLGLSDIGRSRHFYDAALRPLGLARIVDFGNGRGSDYGAAPGSLGVEFTITREPELRTPIAGAHVRFHAPDRGRCARFTPLRWRPAAAMMGCPGFGRSTMPTTTARSYAIRMATASRRCAMRRKPPMVITEC
jgi:catechol 2,3-dioxygenase-like lactoylglutathione lyase family enzyme